MSTPKQILALAIFLLSCSTLSAQGWKLVWSDEFDRPNINPEAWTFEKGCSIRNNEKEYYTDRPENARTENGNLVIETRWENMGDCPYTSASMNTRRKKFWQFGRFEMRAKLPSGPGIWPAFWTCGNVGKWPENGEIDIMEMWGGTNISASSNKVQNAGFETGSLSSWAGRGATFQAAKSNALTGAFSGHISGDGASPVSLEQVVGGLLPNTVYRVSAWVKTTARNIKIAVDKLDGTKHWEAVASGSDYVFLTCNFWTGETDSSVKISFTQDSAGDGYIDDVSVLPRPADNVASQHLHYIGPGVTKNPGTGHDWVLPDGGKLGDAFRIYAAEWWPDRIDFFVDKTKVYTFYIDDEAKRSAYQRPHFVWVNTAVEKDFGPEGYPKQYLIDYIRIYQQDKN